MEHDKMQKRIMIQLTQEESKAFIKLCGECNLCIHSLIERFIKDLIRSSQMDSKDELRTWYENIKDTKYSLVKWLIKENIDIDQFEEFLHELEYESIMKEETDYYLTKLNKRYQQYQKQFLQEYKDANWEEELSFMYQWLIDKEIFLNSRLLEEEIKELLGFKSIRNELKKEVRR